MARFIVFLTLVYAYAAQPAFAQLRDVRVVHAGDRALVEIVTAPDARVAAAPAADGFIVSLPGAALSAGSFETTGGLIAKFDVVNTTEGALIAATTTLDVLSARATPSVSGVVIELALASQASNDPQARAHAEIEARLLGAAADGAAPNAETHAEATSHVAPAPAAGSVATAGPAATAESEPGPTTHAAEGSTAHAAPAHAAQTDAAHDAAVAAAAEALAIADASGSEDADAVMAAFNAAVDPGSDPHADAGAAAAPRAATLDASPEGAGPVEPSAPVVVEADQVPAALARFAPGLDEPACSAAEAVVRGDPWALDSMKLYGACVAARGDAVEARKIFDRLLSFDPADPEGHLGLGAVDEAAGDLDKARKRYQQAIKVSLSDAQAARARAFLAAVEAD